MAGHVRIDALPEDVLDAVEQPFVGVLVERNWIELFLRQYAGELLQELLLFLRELLRDDHLHRHEEVAAASSGDVGHAFTADAERLTTGRSLGNGERLFAIQGRNLDLTTERQRGVVEGDL